MTDPHETPGITAQFSRRAAHEMRSPLGVISQCLKQLEPNVAQADRAYVELAQRSAARLESLARRLETYGRLADGSSPDAAAAPLRHVLQQAINSARSAHSRSRVSVELEIPDSLTRATLESAQCLESAVFELLRNALQHARSRVSVRAGREDDREGWLEIEHDGTSLHEALQDSDSNADMAPAGLGLGLWIARTAAAQAGTTLDVRPRTVRIPVQWHDPDASSAKRADP